MAHRIDQTKLITAVDADVLSGGALDPMPGNGFLRIYAADIVSTATIVVNPSIQPSPTGATAQAVPEAGSGDTAANHPTVFKHMPHWETEVSKGEKVVIGIAGTVSECFIWTQWIGR